MAKIYRRLNLFMAKSAECSQKFTDLLADASVDIYPLSETSGIDGLLCVKKSEERKPNWVSLLDEVTGKTIAGLINRSSSAVIMVRVDGEIYAFTFGYGRYLIEQEYFVQDFGLRTALNTLDEKTLRSVELHTLEDQPVQKKSQAARDSEVSVFGIDISRDVLRAVTGVSRNGVDLKQISGGDSMFSFSISMEAADLPSLARRIKNYYANEDYKKSFSWVDNVRRIKDDAVIEALNKQLVQAIAARNPKLMITLPEIGSWETISGFSFTRGKPIIRPIINPKNYFDTITNLSQISIDSLKKDRLFVHDTNGDVDEHSIYKCIYFEIIEAKKTNIIFNGKWYEIENTFSERITEKLNLIKISSINFPSIEIWSEKGKDRIESEGDYNIRTAASSGYFLLDKKLVKTNSTTSSIELCDLLTPTKQLVHVKHRKGGSAGLSHLFAQGGVAAEIMLGDKEFRKKARTVLRGVSPDAVEIIPLNTPKSTDYEIIFLILGDDSTTLKQNLPFFSKVNLTKAFDNLTQRGFRFSIAGAPMTPRLTS